VNNTVEIKLSAAAQAAFKKLERSPKTALENMRATMDVQNEFTVGHIQERRMTGTGPFPPVAGQLGVRTGRLRRSLRPSRAIIRAGAVLSAIGTNVKYAAIHEFGGRTRPHKIRARRKKALYFSIGGKVVTVKSVNHPGSQIPARRPIRRGIADRRRDYQRAIFEAVTKSLTP
jgi:phage gpG-like protein